MRHLDIYLLLLLLENDYILKAHGYKKKKLFLLSQQSIYISLFLITLGEISTDVL
jgi:hypothetical protein